MNIQYVLDQQGKIIAVVIPIEEWHLLRSRYPEVGDMDSELPASQKELIDQRLNSLKEHPEGIVPGTDFAQAIQNVNALPSSVFKSDEAFITEMDRRVSELESGAVAGLSIEELEDIRVYDAAKAEDDGTRISFAEYLKKRRKDELFS